MTRSTSRTLSHTVSGAALGLVLAGPTFARSSQPQDMSLDKLRQQLTQAGFREVQILDAAYPVRARTQDGNTVLIMID
jgi:hypothetical protein